MGMASLYLVNPAPHLSEQARARASGATDLLDAAVVTETLESAIADCQFVAGTSTRMRGISLPVKTPRDSAPELYRRATQGEKVAIVFGREDSGLTNLELRLCHHQIQIPSVDSFSSLNLASAVQVISYELRMEGLSHTVSEGTTAGSQDNPPVTTADMERYYTHLHKSLNAMDFFKGRHPDNIMSKLRRIYGRCHLDHDEYAILRGILSATCEAAGQREAKPCDSPEKSTP